RDRRQQQDEDFGRVHGLLSDRYPDTNRGCNPSGRQERGCEPQHVALPIAMRPPGNTCCGSQTRAPRICPPPRWIALTKQRLLVKMRSWISFRRKLTQTKTTIEPCNDFQARVLQRQPEG